MKFLYKFLPNTQESIEDTLHRATVKELAQLAYLKYQIIAV